MTNRLSLFEIELLVNLGRKGMKWISRDEDGYLQVFRCEPHMWSPEDQYYEMSIDDPVYCDDFYSLDFVQDIYFSCVKPKEKYLITDLLGT